MAALEPSALRMHDASGPLRQDRWEHSIAVAASEFEQLFRVEFAAVMRSVTLICRDPERAEDVTQEAFVQLLRHWRKVSRYDRPGAWVRRVAIRLAMQHARRERRRPTLEMAASSPPPTVPPLDRDVLDAIAGLPRMQRAAVALYYLEDMPIAEVADVLGCSNSTARVHLHRARVHLAALLGEEVSDDVR